MLKDESKAMHVLNLTLFGEQPHAPTSSAAKGNPLIHIDMSPRYIAGTIYVSFPSLHYYSSLGGVY
jgi:hypothetical protein